MSEVLITVFTPTFNRAHTLPRLYESLISQNVQNFEWLIVYEGYTDNTADFVSRYIKEAKINIQYHHQENQGKHIAINNGVVLARGEFFFIVDSDDYLLQHCTEIFANLASKYQNDPRIGGFTAIHFADDLDIDLTRYGKKEWIQGEEKYVWEVRGERAYCYNTAIMRRFPYPAFKNEFFCPESVVHRRIGREYSVVCTDHVVVRGEYLADGLSKKYSQLLDKNPRGAMLSVVERLRDTTDEEARNNIVKTYWNIALKAKDIPWAEKVAAVPLRYSMKFWWKRLISRA